MCSSDLEMTADAGGESDCMEPVEPVVSLSYGRQTKLYWDKLRLQIRVMKVCRGH